AGKTPDSLADFPHNLFGARLRQAGESLRRAGRRADIGVRIQLVAREDSDHDGVDNLTEILLGHSPGDPADVPTIAERSRAAMVREEFAHFLTSYRWQPFERVHRPAVPSVRNRKWVRNPIDAFIAAEHDARHLVPRP